MQRFFIRFFRLACFFLASGIAYADADFEVKALADAFYVEYFQHFPENATMQALDDFPHDKLTDHSPEAIEQWQQKVAYWLSSLHSIDKNDLKNGELKITYEIMEDYFLRAQGRQLCHHERWDIGPFGWQVLLGMLAEKQPVGTDIARQQAVTRAKAIPAFIDQKIKNLQLGVKTGYVAPKTLLPRIIAQIDGLLSMSAEDSPLFSPANRDEDSNFKALYSSIVKNDIYPALERYRDFLEHEYMSTARDTIGISDIPNGQACYQAMIRWHVTKDVPADEIYEKGKWLLGDLEQSLSEISERAFDGKPMSAVFQEIKLPKYALGTEEAILSYNEAALTRMEKRAPELFNKMPTSAISIIPYPLYRAKNGAPGEYHPPNVEGSEPGIFFINTYSPHTKSRADMESTLFHEAIPGHHYQLALSLETEGRHPTNHALSLEGGAGYKEGWALYAERLAYEMSLFSDDLSQAGFISNNALRAARMVVDPGIHMMGWSKEQALEFLKQHSAMDERVLAGEVDRYIAYPGQATAYSLGMLEIMHLRDIVKEKQKENFDISAFHDQILQYGVLPLELLSQRVKSWLTKDLSD